MTDIAIQRHSLAHLLAMAVLERYPSAQLGMGPATDNGFYYDFSLSQKITPEDLVWLETRMREFIQQPISFVRLEKTHEEAKQLVVGQQFKQEILDDVANQALSFYQSGPFIDLCKGPHVMSTSEVDPEAFCLSHTAGAYFKGDEARPMLTRIYGLAFTSKQELQEYQANREEAKKRDHRKLGADLDLFVFSDLVGPGLPLWTPRGNTLRMVLDERVWKLRQAAGYERVEIPHITKKDLYQASGHWEKFQDELFQIKTREGHQFVMKPMNCPHHTQIFARKRFSYREMPQRYANTTTCYRDEQTGELQGLTRVRAFSQDDAHVFCRPAQMKQEVDTIWSIITQFYATFGFDLSLRLSFHDPEQMESYLGTPELWRESESAIQELATAKGMPYTIGVGEAAFYGPKLDFMAHDSLGRLWQLATIQLDVNMPQRFQLSCINEQGEAETVLMIHAAIMGSLERFIAVLIEHTGGNFPVWLSPVQVALFPVSDDCLLAAEKVAVQLRGQGLRVSVDSSSESVGKKIRAASLQKVPAKIVIGKQEIAAFSQPNPSIGINWRSDLDLPELCLLDELAQHFQLP
jgi:threonyl-tRNA synthetase